MHSLFPDICSTAIPESRDFYVAFLGLEPIYDIGWYVQLRSPRDKNLQLAFVDRHHSSVPEGYRDAPAGVVITVEVEDVDIVHERAVDLGLNMVLSLRDEVFGQRHFMTVDPNGLLVDVVQMIAPTEEFLKEHGLST